ncbi:MAG: hypothetical protein SFU91_08110 [Chloroherpetonaceae bacterium]|nr:hypothetical protein [Chloroherpetonaceae bacterium]
MLVVLYWFLGALCLIFFLSEEFQSFNKKFDTKRSLIFGAAFIIVIFNLFVYNKSTDFGNRPFDPISFVIFGLFNGVLETALFLTAFKLGEMFMSNYTQNKWLLFFAGLLMFMVYGGISHGGFWLYEFPPHLPADPSKMTYKVFFMPVQLALTISWSVMYFLYRDFWGISFLHILVDLNVVYSIHYSIFSKSLSFQHYFG